MSSVASDVISEAMNAKSDASTAPSMRNVATEAGAGTASRSVPGDTRTDKAAAGSAAAAKTRSENNRIILDKLLGQGIVQNYYFFGEGMQARGFKKQKTNKNRCKSHLYAP